MYFQLKMIWQISEPGSRPFISGLLHFFCSFVLYLLFKMSSYSVYPHDAVSVKPWGCACNGNMK